MAACFHPIILAAPQITSYGLIVITIVVNPTIPKKQVVLVQKLFALFLTILWQKNCRRLSVREGEDYLAHSCAIFLFYLGGEI